MKRAVVIVATLGMMVTGCSSNNEPQPVPSSVRTATATPDLSPLVDEQRNQYEYLRDKYPLYFGNIEYEAVVSYFNAVCGAFDAGKTFDEILRISLETIPPDAAGAAIASAIISTCPNHRKDLPG